MNKEKIFFYFVLKLMSTTTTQDTQSRSSYLAIALSITSRIFCCTSCDTTTTITTERPIIINSSQPVTIRELTTPPQLEQEANVEIVS